MKYGTTWDLKLLYKNEKDPEINKDIKKIENLNIAFEKKYRGKDFTNSDTKLLKALQDLEKLRREGTWKPWWYFALRVRINGEDTKAHALKTKIEQQLNTSSNKIEFFFTELAKIPKTKQKEYLRSKKLEKYKQLLSRIFDRAQYKLTEKEEQLENLLSQTSYTMWIDEQTKSLHQNTVSFKGKKLPLAEAMSKVRSLKDKDRQTLHTEINNLLKEKSNFATAEINAVYNYKKTMDELRGYKKPYSATVIGYENNEKEIEDLVQTVTKNFTISKKFYTLHTKLLKKKKTTLADRNIQIGEIKKKFDFDSSINLVRDAFSEIDSEYADIFDSFLKNNQIDVFPKKGKNSGAFCWGVGQLPTFVFLNHSNDIRSVETLAHEMGHAIHTEFSKKQTPFYRYYTIATAEVASTFFEQFVNEKLTQILTQKEQVILLHNKILGDISTVFRQIACFNFELELHETIRENGKVSNEKIAKLLNKHMKAYLGPAVEINEDDGYFFVDWSHIRRFFYVYSYAYGQLISRALYEKWKEDKSYNAKIKQFLSAGSSMSPKDIFKSIGINTNTAFFETGLKSIEKDIKKLEQLAKAEKMI